MTRTTTLLPLLLVLLAGCKTYSLGPEWKPLTTVVERPSLPFASDTATTTKGSHVYVVDLPGWLMDYPPGSVEFVALMRHERTHAVRQFRYKDLPGELAVAAWVARYLADHKFMWEEEQQGFYHAIKHLQVNGHWDWLRTLRVAHAMSHKYKTVTGEHMVSEAEAKAWIESVLNGIWTP